MSLDSANSIRKNVKRYPSGMVCTTYFFKCSVCSAEISCQSGFLKKHSGKCNACSHTGRPYQSAYAALLHNTTTRGIEVLLTYDEFFELCAIKTCHYCDDPIRRTTKRGEPGYRGYFVDRKDNDAPYVLANCVPCCWRCNQAKGDRFTYDQFVEIADRCFKKRVARERDHAFCELNGWDPWD